MKYRLSVALIFFLVILVSCGQNEGGGASLAPTASVPNISVPANPSANPVLPGNTAAPIIPGGKLNPAHGQPGHRCDLAVGAPLPSTTASAPLLNTPTAAPLQTAASATTPVTIPQPAANTAANGKGLNPAHGQPGHRCDIPVGQPLNSAPAKPQSTTTPSPVITPKIDSAPDTMLAKGLNPAHGKPGHRCDIAVGQPLTSAKKDTSSKK